MMAEDPQSQSARAKARAAAGARRRAKALFRQGSFDLLASGYSAEQIAEARKVSVRTIKREIDAVIAARRLDAPERYVHLQVARLTKALRLADVAIERGDLKAVQALVQVVKISRSLSWVEAPRRLREGRLIDGSRLARRGAASAASWPDPRPSRSRARVGGRARGRFGKRDRFRRLTA